MNGRHVNVVVAGLVTCGLAAIFPAVGGAQDIPGAIQEGTQDVTGAIERGVQNVTELPKKGYVTLVGCFTQGTIKNHERYVLLNPTVGPATTVPDSACSATGNDRMIKLERVKKHYMAERIALGQWIEVSGKLEKNGDQDEDNVRELEVSSFRPVPVAAPHVAEVIPTPTPPPPAPPAVTPPAAPTVEPAAPAPEAPAAVGTTGVTTRHRLPHTESPLPLAGLMALISFGLALALQAKRRRMAGRG